MTEVQLLVCNMNLWRNTEIVWTYGVLVITPLGRETIRYTDVRGIKNGFLLINDRVFIAFDIHFQRSLYIFIFYKCAIAVKCVNQIHQALGKLSYQPTPVIHLCQPNAKILTFVSTDICLLKYTILASSWFGLKPPEMSNNISILHAYTWEPKY